MTRDLIRADRLHAGPSHDPYRAYIARGRVERSLAVRAAFAALGRSAAALLRTPAASVATPRARTV